MMNEAAKREAQQWRQWCDAIDREIAPLFSGPHVYFVQSINEGPIKIGFTTNLARRIAQLNTGSSARLVIIASMPAGRAYERHLHRRLAAHRLHGEWFADCDEVRATMQVASDFRRRQADEWIARSMAAESVPDDTRWLGNPIEAWRS